MCSLFEQLGYGKAIYILDTGGKVYRLQDVFSLICENVSVFDSCQMQLFTAKQLDGSFKVYSYDSMLGFTESSPGLVLAIKDSDFNQRN